MTSSPAAARRPFGSAVAPCCRGAVQHVLWHVAIGIVRAGRGARHVDRRAVDVEALRGHLLRLEREALAVTDLHRPAHLIHVGDRLVERDLVLVDSHALEVDTDAGGIRQCFDERRLGVQLVPEDRRGLLQGRLRAHTLGLVRVLDGLLRARADNLEREAGKDWVRQRAGIDTATERVP
mgnify:CR=1 FL=1